MYMICAIIWTYRTQIMPLLLNQTDAGTSSEDKSNGTGNALLLQECFFISLLNDYYTVF